MALSGIDEVLITDATHPTTHPSFASQGEGFITFPYGSYKYVLFINYLIQAKMFWGFFGALQAPHPTIVVTLKFNYTT